MQQEVYPRLARELGWVPEGVRVDEANSVNIFASLLAVLESGVNCA